MKPASEFETRLKITAEGMRGPSPSDRGLEQILSRRARGDRVALSPTLLRRPWHAVRWVGLGVAAALLVLIALRSNRSDRVSGDGPDIFAPADLLGQAGGSQTGPLGPRIPVPEEGRLEPGVWVYRRHLTGRAAADPPVRDSVSLRPTLLDGRPVWLVVNEMNLGREGADRIVDSTWVERRTLRPLRTAFYAKGWPGRVTTFDDDSIRLNWKRDHRPTIMAAVRTPGPPLWNQGLTFAGLNGAPLFAAIPLTATWRGSFPHLRLLGDGVLHVYWRTLRVSGVEQITVPGGTFDCWKLTTEATAGSEGAAWIDRRSGMLVRTLMTDANAEPTDLMYFRSP